MYEEIASLIYLITYFYMLYLNLTSGKKGILGVDLVVVKCITLLNMILSIFIFNKTIGNSFILASVILPYFIPLFYHFESIKTRSENHKNNKFLIFSFLLTILLSLIILVL